MQHGTETWLHASEKLFGSPNISGQHSWIVHGMAEHEHEKMRHPQVPVGGGHSSHACTGAWTNPPRSHSHTGPIPGVHGAESGCEARGSTKRTFPNPNMSTWSLLIRHQRCACSQRASFGRMQLKMWKINFPLDLGRGIFRGTSDLSTFFFSYLVHFFFQNPGTGKRGWGEAWKSASGVPKMKFQYKSAIGTIQKELRILHLKCF